MAMCRPLLGARAMRQDGMMLSEVQGPAMQPWPPPLLPLTPPPTHTTTRQHHYQTITNTLASSPTGSMCNYPRRPALACLPTDRSSLGAWPRASSALPQVSAMSGAHTGTSTPTPTHACMHACAPPACAPTSNQQPRAFGCSRPPPILACPPPRSPPLPHRPPACRYTWLGAHRQAAETQSHHAHPSPYATAAAPAGAALDLPRAPPPGFCPVLLLRALQGRPCPG